MNLGDDVTFFPWRDIDGELLFIRVTHTRGGPGGTGRSLVRRGSQIISRSIIGKQAQGETGCTKILNLYPDFIILKGGYAVMQDINGNCDRVIYILVPEDDGRAYKSLMIPLRIRVAGHIPA